MLRALDSSRPARLVGISLALALGAGLLVWSGERSWNQPADITPSPPLTAESASAAPSVVRVLPSDLVAPTTPLGSVTLRLFDVPLAEGFVPSQLNDPTPTNTLSPALGTDTTPAAGGEDLASEPAVGFEGDVELELSVQPLATRYSLGLRGRCAQPETDEGDNCKVTLKLNGSAIARLGFSEDTSLQSTQQDYAHLNPGGNKLRLEVEAENDVLVSHLSLLPISEKLELNIGTLSARPYLVRGFYADETDGDRSAAWSSALSSVLALVVEPKPVEYELRLLAHAARGIAPLSVAATLNGKPLGSRNFGQGWGYYNYRVPKGTLQRGANQLELTYPTAARPKETEPGSGDTRLLSVRLERLWLGPKG